MRKQSGLSLVELMVSITLGLILVGGVVQMLLGTKLTFNSQKATSRVQESGRLAVEFMARDIRMAGYMGCVSRSGLTAMRLDSTVEASNFTNDFLVSVKGYSVGDSGDAAFALLGSSSAFATGAAAIVPNLGTDILELTGATGSGLVVNKENTHDTVFAEDNGDVNSNCYKGLCKDDVLIVNDCVKARVFQVTAVADDGVDVKFTHAAAAGTKNNIGDWGTAVLPDPLFAPGSEIIKMEKKFYYIKNNTAGEPSLYLWINGVETELIEGIEDMVITYGRDTGSDSIPDAYQTAATVTAANAWDKVLSVRVELLVRTPEPVLNEDQYVFFPLSAATATQYTDRRLRQVFTATVGVRSRLQ
jgi:type IV pilus assembly protein PilW